MDKSGCGIRKLVLAPPVRGQKETYDAGEDQTRCSGINDLPYCIPLISLL